MLHSKSLGSTTILNAWRSFSLRQLSTNLTQDRKLVITKHLVQPNIDPSSGKTALHDPKRSTHRNGRPVKPPPRALARPGLPHQAPGDSKTRSTSVIPCHLYMNTRRHKLVTSIPSEWGEYSEKLAKLRIKYARGQSEPAPQDSRDTENSPRRSPAPHSHPNVQEPSNQAPGHAASATQAWLARLAHNAVVIPKHICQIECPAGNIPPSPPTAGPIPKRTQEDKRRSEAVLKAPVSLLAKYISPQMFESIRESPYYVRDEGAVVISCHQHQKQAGNKQLCFRQLNCFIKNVAREMMYRENMGKMNESQTVLVSEAEMKTMAWNLKKSFNDQMKKKQRKAKGAES